MIWVSLFGYESICQSLCSDLGGQLGKIEMRSFPDGETYLNCLDDYSGKKVVIVDSLIYPNDKIIPLLWLCETLRDLGASEIGLVCPYLCYMRQDKRFKPGEALSSSYFAKLLSSYVNWLVTIDPHLHRIKSLSEIYSIPTDVIHAAPWMASWIQEHIENPCLIGPDSESQQWVEAMASELGCPYYVLTKQRLGDTKVSITLPDNFHVEKYTPVLVDDMISSAGTMIKAIDLIHKKTHQKAHCVAIHGLFSQDAYQKLKNAGAASIVTSQTILHESNEIQLISPIKASVEKMLKSG